jgi:hypothetical protein
MAFAVVAHALLLLCSCSNSPPAVAADATAQTAPADSGKQIPTDDIFAAPASDPASWAVAAAPVVAAANAGVDPVFGVRPPRPCPAIGTIPTQEQVRVLVQCTMDYIIPQQAKVHQDITVTLGASRPAGLHDFTPHADTASPVLDFTGSASAYLCGPVSNNPGSNCDRYQYQDSPGICWKTLDGDYKCQLTAHMTGPVRLQPPPTTY